MPDDNETVNTPGIGKDADGMTVRQRAFAEHYVVLLNGTRAAIAAGYAEAGAHVIASNLLRHIKVKAYIEKLFEAGRMGKHEVIGQLTALSRANIGDYLKIVKVERNGVTVEEWRFDLVKAVKDHNTAMIKSIKRDKFGVVVEMYDKVRTLELIGKHNRLFADVHIQGDKPDQTADVLSDEALAAIAANTHDVADVVDEFEAEDAVQHTVTHQVNHVIVPDDEIGENSRGLEDGELE